MVNAIYSDVQKLRDEVRKLRGRLDSITAGSTIIPQPGPGGTLPVPTVGALITGNATPVWVTLNRSVPASAVVRNVLALDQGDTIPSWKAALDNTNPTTIAPSATASPGTSLIFSHRDHTHGAPATFPATAHNILSLTHADSTAAAAVRGDVITAQGASPTWSRLAASVPAALVRNVLGLDNGDTEPAWKTALDATAPTTAAAGDAASPGTSLIFSHRDHRHGMPGSFDTPHPLLDGTQNNDTLAAAPTRGAIIVGNSTPKWASVTVGAAGSVVWSDGTDTITTINPKVAGYLRVGSATAPTNVTAGDATTTRLFVGTDAAFGKTAILELNQASTVPPNAASVAAYVTTILAGDGTSAGNTHGGLLVELFARPTANDAASYRAAEFNASHDSGTFNLTGTLIALRGAVTQATASTTVTELRACNFNVVVSAGDVTTVNTITTALVASGGGTITTWNGLLLTINSFPTAITTARGINLGNYGNAAVTTAVGIDITAQAGAVTTNFDIRSAGNSVFGGYLRIGSVSAPTAVTSGDLTVVRISLANTAFGTGGEFIIAQQTLTTTAAGADVFYGFNPLIGPAGASSTQFRIWQQTAQMGTGAGTLNVVTNMFLRNDHRGASTVTISETTGINVIALELTSSSNATPGNVTTARGIFIQALQGSSGKTITTVTTAIGIDIQVSVDSTTSFTNVTNLTDIRLQANTSGAAITTRKGLDIQNLGSGGTVTTAVGIDIAAFTGATTSIGLRNASKLRQVDTAMFGVDAAASAQVHIAQQTLGNEVFRIESVATNDDPSERVFQNRAATTDATVTTLHTYTAPATTTSMLVAYVTARRTGGSAGTAEDSAAYTIIACIKNVAGTATIVGVVSALTVMEDQVAWDATIDVTGGTARVRVTGAVNNNVTWHITLRILPVGT